MKKALKPLVLVCLLTIGMISSSDARRITTDPTPTCITSSFFIDIFFGHGITISVTSCD